MKNIDVFIANFNILKKIISIIYGNGNGMATKHIYIESLCNCVQVFKIGVYKSIIFIIVTGSFKQTC